MELVTLYKEVKNEEKNGIELYFEAIPTYKEREELKNNGYKWNPAKKCWYVKIGGTKRKEKGGANELGVKVGDMFVMVWGYEQTNNTFYVVTALKGKTQVVLEEVVPALIKDEPTGYDAANRVYSTTDYAIIDNGEKITKKVKGTKESPYIDICSYGLATRYTGRTLYESWYY
jgi:hypothetical protein